MSLLLVGLSHHSAPLDVLELAALDATGARELATTLLGAEHVTEAAVLATCNRLEVYADVTAFHGGLADVGTTLSVRTGMDLATLTDHLYVQYAEHAVGHLFTVTAGLDSMAIGEAQVLGQVRAMLRRGQDDGSIGRVLDPLLQQALRVGKRAHSETGLDSAGHSLVHAALAHAGELAVPLDRARTLVVGAGAMSALAVAVLARSGARSITVANRTADRARRLAEPISARWLTLDDDTALVRALAAADVVVSCTGAVGQVLTADLVQRAQALGESNGTGSQRQLIVDLALPHDVAPEVATLERVSVIGLAELGDELANAEVGADLEAAAAIVAEEVEAYLSQQRAAAVAPTVVALRSYAGEVVAGELARLRQRLGDTVDDRVRGEVEQTVSRVVDKLLHTPTVRVKSLATEDGGHYAAVLRELFDLDMEAISSGTTLPNVAEALAVAPTVSAGPAAQPAPRQTEPGSES